MKSAWCRTSAFRIGNWLRGQDYPPGGYLEPTTHARARKLVIGPTVKLVADQVFNHTRSVSEFAWGFYVWTTGLPPLHHELIAGALILRPMPLERYPTGAG